MKIPSRKHIVITFLSISSIFYFSSICFGQSEEEMNALRLFYDDTDLVISSTRYPKPVSQVAENITVITADDIAAMNAHTVGEVLNRVPGLFISTNRDFGSYSLINIQGSEPRHTLVLVDDVPWNIISEGSAETITVPVGIIERIEIIKGPASSAWGSSLGGVINIITKPAGNTEIPGGSVEASYGKGNSREYRAGISGRFEKAGYYLYAGGLESDGLIHSRSADNVSLYSKIEIPFSEKADTGFTIGYSDTDNGLGDFPNNDINVKGSIRSFYAAPYLNSRISRALTLRLSAYYFRQEIGQQSNALGLGFVGQAGDLFQSTIYKEESWGGKGQIVWVKDSHTVVSGVDFEKGEYNQLTRAGDIIQMMGIPAVSRFSPDNTKWAVYANDTITWGKWSVVPGIRYDHESVTGSFVSPSLGIIYVPRKDTILRGTVARGFSTPSLSWTSGGGLVLDPNPALKYEEIWSYQAGVESTFSFLWVKANVFLHDLKNSIVIEPSGGGPPNYNDICINDGKVRRKGFEIEAETSPMHNFSFRGGLSYVDIDPPNNYGSSKTYNYVAGIKYENNSLKGQLFGYYNDFDIDTGYDDFIWDLNINKKYYLDKESFLELFAVAHNLFDGSQSASIEYINPGRWLEAGIKFRF